MKRMRIMGLALVAVFAMTAIVASSASATAPEFGRCVAKAGGKFQEAGCKKKSVAGKEKFEWEPGVVKNKFKSKLKEGVPTLETVSGVKVTCKSEESPGEFNSNKSVAGVVAKFGTCELGEAACTSAGAGEGEIITSALEGVLGVEKVGATPDKNKLALELHAPGTAKVAEFVCAGLPNIVRGSVLHNVLANKMLLTSVEKFTATKGEQKPDKFAGEGTDAHILEASLKATPFEEAGQTITATVTYEEKVEASSVN